MASRNQPIGIHDVTIASFEPTSTGVGLYQRTVYLQPDGTHAIVFQGKMYPAQQSDEGSFSASVDLRKTKR